MRPRHRVAPARRRHESRSVSRRSESAAAAAGNARTTTSPPTNNSSRSRHACRNRRVTLLRTTEPPTARPTTKPTRGRSQPPPTACTTSVRDPARRPCRVTRAKSRRRRRRAEAGNTRATCTDDGACSGGETLAPLAATVGQDRSPRSGTHAQAKTVRLVTTTVVGLERALAHERGSTIGERTADRRPCASTATVSRGRLPACLCAATVSTAAVSTRRLTASRYGVAARGVKHSRGLHPTAEISAASGGCGQPLAWRRTGPLASSWSSNRRPRRCSPRRLHRG